MLPPTRLHAITLMLFICPTFPIRSCSLLVFRLRLPCHRASSCTSSESSPPPYIGPFRAIPIFARSPVHTSINFRGRKRGGEREREKVAHYRYLFLFSFPSPLSLAHFNIPPINRSASSNLAVSHYPRLNFVQNVPFFSARLPSLSNFRACKRAGAINSPSTPPPLAPPLSHSLYFSFIRIATLCADRYLLIHCRVPSVSLPLRP